MTTYTGYHDSGPVEPIIPQALAWAYAHADAGNAALEAEIHRRWPMLNATNLVRLIRGYRLAGWVEPGLVVWGKPPAATPVRVDEG